MGMAADLVKQIASVNSVEVYALPRFSTVLQAYDSGTVPEPCRTLRSERRQGASDPEWAHGRVMDQCEQAQRRGQAQQMEQLQGWVPEPEQEHQAGQRRHAHHRGCGRRRAYRSSPSA